jgi:hypothetical protein
MRSASFAARLVMPRYENRATIQPLAVSSLSRTRSFSNRYLLRPCVPQPSHSRITIESTKRKSTSYPHTIGWNSTAGS